MEWINNDGGRAAAGYRGEAGDCVVRAIAIAAQVPYRGVYNALKIEARRERPRRGHRSTVRDGVTKATYRRYLESLGWTWTATMGIGTGCRVHLQAGELPAGRLIVSLSRHLCAVIDGVIQDTHDPSRDGTRCVYGYWRPVTALINPLRLAHPLYMRIAPRTGPADREGLDEGRRDGKGHRSPHQGGWLVQGH